MTIEVKSITKRIGLGAALAATALIAAVPAQARDGYHDRGDGAAIAVGAGILGLAVGAAIADRSDGRYYDRRYYGERRYVTIRDRPGYYYYYDGSPNRYYQDRYYDRYYAPYRRDYWRDGRGWDRRPGWDRRDRGWDHRDYGRDRNWGGGRDHNGDRGRDHNWDRGRDQRRGW
jgi:hypothetical protein